MKKSLFAFIALSAAVFVSCNPKQEQNEPIGITDSTFVSEEIRYFVQCNPAALQLMDITLDYLAYPDEVVKTTAVTGNWTSETFSAPSGTFGIRLNIEPKDGFTVTDDLFDATNGVYLRVGYGSRHIFKENIPTEFDNSILCYTDLRGKQKYKDQLTAENIRRFSYDVAYSFLYDPETDYITVTTIKDFWKNK